MIFNSNEEKKKKRKTLNVMGFIYLFIIIIIIIIFNSNEDSGANFWVSFKMDPKFQDFEELIFSLFVPIISNSLMLMCEGILVYTLK